MKKLLFLSLFILTVCFSQCQTKPKVQGALQQARIIAYDEYSDKKVFNMHDQMYDVSVKIYNKTDLYVKYKNERYYDREVHIVVQKGNTVVFEITLNKDVFKKYYKTGDIDNRLIYNCHLSEAKDTSFLFNAEVNICEPETDNCKFFSLDFKQEGTFNVREEESSNEGEE